MMRTYARANSVDSHRDVVTVVVGSALVGALAWCVTRGVRGRRGASDRVRGVDLVLDCEHVSASAVALVAGHGDGGSLQTRWEQFNTRLVELEWRATDTANATRCVSRQRALDQVAAALISLRGALEAAIRLRLEPDTPKTLLRAVDDAVVVRSEDLAISTRVLSSYPPHRNGE